MVSRSDMSCFSENQGQFRRVAVEYVEYYEPPDVLWLSADNTSGPQPLTVAFHLEIMSASGSLTFLWDFGEGTILSPSLHGDAVHTYTTIEEYPATVRLIDSKGTSVDASTGITATEPIPE